MKKAKGITLISLIIMIIVLIILAGVAINFAMGENGIITRTRNAKQQYTQEEIKEKLNLKIADIQIEKQGNANLSDLDGLNLEGYAVSAGSIGRMITVTKGSETYIFWVDSNLNITEFDGNISIENNNNSNNNTTIQEFTPIISNINGTYFTIEANATSSESTVLAYEFFVNNEYKGLTLANTSNTMDITGLELDTEYEVYVVALDDKGTIRRSTVVKQKTLDKQYLIKDGINQLEFTSEHNNSISENDGYRTVSTMSTNYRAAYYTDSSINLSKYSKLNVDVEVTSKTGDSIFYLSLFNENDNPTSTIDVNNITILGETETNKTRNIYTMDISNNNNKYVISLWKNGTNSATQVIYNIYNLWLEK